MIIINVNIDPNNEEFSFPSSRNILSLKYGKTKIHSVFIILVNNSCFPAIIITFKHEVFSYLISSAMTVVKIKTKQIKIITVK